MTLSYPMPEIRNINDVLPHIVGRPEFIVVKKDYGITVVNYAFQGADTFPPVTDVGSAILRECRGIVFDSETGDLVSRRLHKFMNHGEREGVSVIDVSKPHQVLEKLDGSMISPILMDGGVRYISKMGLTSVSMQAETFCAAHPEYDSFSRHCISWDATPVFEWCSPANRIVIPYDEDNLILLVIRDNREGFYWPYEFMISTAQAWGIPFVKAVCPPLTSSDAFDRFKAMVCEWEGAEGVVIAWEDGSRIKIKASHYVSLHRAKSLTENERDVVGLILDEKTDDLLPLLPDADKTSLLDFQTAVWDDIWSFVQIVARVRRSVDHLSRKEFAQTEGVDPTIRAAVFAIWDTWEGGTGPVIHDWAVAFIRKNLGNRGAFETKARSILKTARWIP